MAEIFSPRSFYSKSPKFTLTTNPTNPIINNVLKSSEKYTTKSRKRDRNNIQRINKTTRNKITKNKNVLKEKTKTHKEIGSENKTKIKKVQDSNESVNVEEENVSATSRFFKCRKKGLKKNFTKENFQPKELNNPFKSRSDASGLDMYKLMSNCLSDKYEDYQMEVDDSSDDDDSDDNSESDDDSYDNYEELSKSQVRKKIKLECVEFSLVSDDEEEDDDVLKDINEDIWDKLDDDYKENDTEYQDGKSSIGKYKSISVKSNSPNKKIHQNTLTPMETTPESPKSPKPKDTSPSKPSTNDNNHSTFDYKSLSFSSNDVFGMTKGAKSSFVPKSGAYNTHAEPKLYQMTLVCIIYILIHCGWRNSLLNY